METELKLKVAQADLARLREHALLADLSDAAPEEHELRDTYFDTPKLDLWHNGLTLRVRGDGDAWIQTVKTAGGGSAGLHQRGEWESSLPGPDPDPVELARQIKSKRIAELLRAPDVVNNLRPVFNNTTRRTQWNIQLPDGQQVECVLDAGDIHVGGRNAPIGELELELKRGDPTPLFELALSLHKDIPLQIAGDSKAARGYALLDGEPPPARPAKRYIKALSALQDKLGLLNDLAVAGKLFDELEARGPADELRYARGYVTATSRAESHHLGRALRGIARLKMMK